MERDICSNRHKGNANSFLANLRVAGRKHSLCDRIYLSLYQNGPQTCEQLSLRLGIRYTTCSGRVSELKAEKLIWETGEQRETTAGATASVLAVTTAKERARLLEPGREYKPRQATLFTPKEDTHA